MQVVVKETEYEVAKAVADSVVTDLQEQLKKQESASLVLAGGSSFKEVYTLLATPEYQTALAWSKVVFYFGDERCVPPSDKRSNFKFVYDCWLHMYEGERVPVVQRMKGEVDPQVACEEYKAVLPDQFTVVLLGIGPDGHTASLFPGSLKNIGEDQEVAVTEAERDPFVSRITLTPRSLNSGQSIYIVAMGGAKSQTVKDIVTGTRPDYPVLLIQPQKKEAVFFLDQEAAQLL